MFKFLGAEDKDSLSSLGLFWESCSIRHFPVRCAIQSLRASNGRSGPEEMTPRRRGAIYKERDCLAANLSHRNDFYRRKRPLCDVFDSTRSFPCYEFRNWLYISLITLKNNSTTCGSKCLPDCCSI